MPTTPNLTGGCAICGEPGATVECKSADGTSVALHRKCLARHLTARHTELVRQRDGLLALGAEHLTEIMIEVFEVLAQRKPLHLPKRKTASVPTVAPPAKEQHVCAHCQVVDDGGRTFPWKPHVRESTVWLHDQCTAAYGEAWSAAEQHKNQAAAAARQRDRDEKRRDATTKQQSEPR